MRYAQPIKDKVRLLRASGLSLNQIKNETNVPITTIRTWIADIHLSEEQLSILKNRTQSALQQGRMRAQTVWKEQRAKKEHMLILEGQEDIGVLTKRDLFIAGIALYWAEGFKNKHERRLGFCNSDPYMIRFYIQWLEKILHVNKKDIIARLTLNILYRDKARQIENYWSEITGVPSDQFTKTFYQNTQWKKQYNTAEYKGVLRIHLRDSLEHLWKMKGWIEGLKLSLPG